MPKDKLLKLVEAVALYSAGLDHSGAMDDLAIMCTDDEWQLVLEALELAKEAIEQED